MSIEITRPTPRAFFEEELKLNAWGKIGTILDAIEKGHKKILIRSCNGAGKTTLLGALTAYYLKYYDDVKIIATGANATQLKNNYWAATKRYCKECKLANADNKPTSSRFEVTPLRSAQCISPQKPEAAQGYHAKLVVLIVDEATALNEDMMTALMSNATGDQFLVLMTYNPIESASFVFDIETNALEYMPDLPIDQNKWLVFGISAFEHPNVISGTQIIPGAISRDYVEGMLRTDTMQCANGYPDAIYTPWIRNKEGELGTYWIPTAAANARVCGKWSDISESGFISNSLVVAAWRNEDATKGMHILGVDAGGGQDPTVFTFFDGNRQEFIETINTAEYGIISNHIIELCEKYEIDAIGIDDGGIGHGITDRLQEQQKNGILPKTIIVPINFGSKPKNFFKIRNPQNTRAEMYLNVEKELRAGELKLFYSKPLQKELCSQKMITAKNSSFIRLEDKEIIRRRIGRSPDLADATAIARYVKRLLPYFTQSRLMF